MGTIGKKLRMKRFKQSLLDISRNGKLRNLLFDKILRTDTRYKTYRESYFHFYNRSSRGESQKIRDLLEGFIANYPVTETSEVIARLRSGNDKNFKSAFFELILHDALLKKGYKLTVHPTLPNENTAKPDFLVETDNGEQFYLEATLASEANDINKGGESRKQHLMDYISDKPHPNFMLDIDDSGFPKSQPSSKKLLTELHLWLDSLNPDEIEKQAKNEGLESITPLTWSHDGWEIFFRPIPLKPERRGKSRTLIGVSSSGASFVDHWSPIRDAVKAKGGKYGKLDKPLLIAVNLDSFFIDRIDEMQALFGEEVFIYQAGNPDKEPEMERAPNGVWRGKGGPQYTRVSGVWIFSDLHASVIVGRRQTIYLNPWATLPLPDSLKSFPHALAQGGNMRWVEGETMADILGLSPNWPE